MIQKPVLVLGSTCVDVIIRVDHLPKTEENLHPSSQKFAIGGCAYNVANILGRAGANVSFVTPVGLQGVYGGYVLSHLKKLPFVSPVVLPNGQNGCCYCLVEENGERTFLSIHGAEYTFDPAWMEPFSGNAYAFTYLCGLEVEEATGGDLVNWLEKENHGEIFYAPGPRGVRVNPDLTRRLFALHPILHLNQQEAAQLSQKQDLEEAVSALYDQTGNTVIVTLGAVGAAFFDGNHLVSVPGIPAAQVIDTIGAGDAHAGAVLTALSRGKSMKESIAFANRVSSAVVQTEGATLCDSVLHSILKTLI